MTRKSLAQGSVGFGPMVPVALLTKLCKRLGLGKPIVRLGLRRILSQETKERAFAGYQPTRHDVFVATFGKSGTNWMMQIAQQIAHRGHAEFEHIHDVVPWPDSPVPVATPLSGPGSEVVSPTGLRVIKTHLETGFVPYSEEATYLTVLRDPKEVLVSSYYFLGGMLGVLSHVTIDDWFDLFTTPGTMAASWATHTASFWAWRDRPNVLVLGYREITEAARASIERVAEKMGVALTAAELDSVVERSRVEYMKAHESQFAPPRLPFMREAERPRMIQRGRAGASEELLSRDQQATIDRICQEELRRLGSDFPYASTFDVVTAAADRRPPHAR